MEAQAGSGTGTGTGTSHIRVRFHIIRNARIEHVGKSQPCMVSKVRIVCQQTVQTRGKNRRRKRRWRGVGSGKRHGEMTQDG